MWRIDQPLGFGDGVPITFAYPVIHSPGVRSSPLIVLLRLRFPGPSWGTFGTERRDACAVEHDRSIMHAQDGLVAFACQLLDSKKAFSSIIGFVPCF